MLFASIIICINTTTNEYYMQLRGLVKASIEPDKKEIIHIKLNILFFNIYFYPLRKSNTSNQRTKTEKNDGKMDKNRISIRKGLRILRTFKVKRFLLDIDTGDCISNAKLYPFFALLNYKGGNFKVNYNDRNIVLLLLRNRPINLIISFIKN